MALMIKKCSKNWLKEALSVIQPTDGRQMLTLKEFITATEFKIDKWSMDKFFHNIKDDVPLYIDDETIKWFGYHGLMKKQKEKIRTLLQKNFAEYENKLWFEYSNTDYTKFYEENPMSLAGDIENSTVVQIDEVVGSNVYPDPHDIKGNKTKHMIVHPDIFKHIVLMADTQKASEIRDYYITIEDLIKKYSHYQVEQLKVSNFSLAYKLDQMRIESAEERKKSEEERKKSEEERKLQDIRFNKLIGVASESKDQVAKLDKKLDDVLPNVVDFNELTISDEPQIIIMRDRDAKPGDLNLYYMRCQLKYVNRSIKALRAKYGVSIHRSFTIKQPNAVAFWKSILKKYAKNIIKDSTSNWFKLCSDSIESERNMSRREFYKAINTADNNRKQKQ